jgi:tryptophan-rich sensory protein
MPDTGQTVRLAAPSFRAVVRIVAIVAACAIALYLVWRPSTSHRDDRLVAFIIVYQRIENTFIQPVVHGRALKVNPIVTILAVLVGASLLGILARCSRSRSPPPSRSCCATGGRIGRPLA